FVLTLSTFISPHLYCCHDISFLLFFRAFLLFFFLLIRRPPISTLFPYTTLSDLEFFEFGFTGSQVFFGELSELVSAVREFASLKDRKSTRLNSSHVKISYAVFCLKKKKSHRGRCRHCQGRPVSLLRSVPQSHGTL